MTARSKGANAVLYVVLTAAALVFLIPIFVVLINSFKGRFFISSDPFSLPTGDLFVGFENYVNGIRKIGFFSAFFTSLFITVASTGAILLLTSMTAWYLVRIKTRITKLLYYLFVASMIVPFQMVMFTMSKVANLLHLDNPLGIVIIYVGFGAGLSVFLFCGFIKAIPIQLEEAASIDGCTPIQGYFHVILPVLRPTMITVAILNAMWIWNDYLLPTLVIGNNYKTIPVAVQYLQGGYGSRDMGALMAMLVLSILPIIVFYLICQKYIIRGMIAGAVKG